MTKNPDDKIVRCDDEPRGRLAVVYRGQDFDSGTHQGHMTSGESCNGRSGLKAREGGQAGTRENECRSSINRHVTQLGRFPVRRRDEMGLAPDFFAGLSGVQSAHFTQPWQLPSPPSLRHFTHP